MVKLYEIDKILLYSIQSKKNDIVNGLKLCEENGILKILRNNFSRFWNLITKEQRIKYLKLSIQKEELYESVEKIIRYTDEVSRELFLEKFMGIKLFEDKYSAYNILTETDDDDKFDNMKHNILRFWMSLDVEEKRKFVYVINNYWEKNKYEEYFYEESYKFSEDINDYDIDKYETNKMLFCIEEELESIDLLHTEDMLYINCSYNKIKKLDDLPRHLKTLVCDNNNLTMLNNLPPKIKYLDCSSNDIIEILNVPSELIFLKCSSNKITLLEKLPNTLLTLFCDYNKITSLENLPNSLELLVCDDNKITLLENLPLGLKYLSCGKNKINSLNNLPKKLSYLQCSYNRIENIELPVYLQEFISVGSNLELDLFPNMLNHVKLNDVDGYVKWKLPYGIEKISTDNEYNFYETMSIPKSVKILNDKEIKIKDDYGNEKCLRY